MQEVPGASLEGRSRIGHLVHRYHILYRTGAKGLGLRHRAATQDDGWTGTLSGTVWRQDGRMYIHGIFTTRSRSWAVGPSSRDVLCYRASTSSGAADIRSLVSRHNWRIRVHEGLHIPHFRRGVAPATSSFHKHTSQSLSSRASNL